MATTPKKDTVTTPSAQYAAYAEDRRLIAICLGGTQSMREAGRVEEAEGTALCANILPRAPGETKVEYWGRRAQSFAHNLVEDAIADHCDRVFRNPPSLGDDVPDLIRGKDGEKEGEATPGWAETFDLVNHWQVFARQLYASAKADGVAAVLVDMPPIPRLEDGSVAEFNEEDRKRNGRRPYAVLVKRDELIEVQPRYVNGRRRIGRARRKRQEARRSGRWTPPEMVTVVDVYYDGLDPAERFFPADHPRSDAEGGAPSGEILPKSPLRWAYFERYEVTEDPKTKEEIEVLVEAGPMSPVTEVPLVELNLAPENQRGFFDGRPQFVPLAEVQVEHFQFWSRLATQIRVCNTAILCRFGFTEKDLKSMQEVGALRSYNSTNTEARVEFVEPAGGAIATGLAVIKEILERGKELSRAAMLPQSGGVVATDTVLRQARADSQLEAEVYRLVDCLEGCFHFMIWLATGEPGQGGSLTIDREALSLMRVGTFADVMALYDAGALTKRTLLSEAKRYGNLGEDIDVDEEIKALEQETPPKTGASLNLDEPPGKGSAAKLLALLKRVRAGDAPSPEELDAALQESASSEAES